MAAAMARQKADMAVWKRNRCRKETCSRARTECHRFSIRDCDDTGERRVSLIEVMVHYHKLCLGEHPHVGDASRDNDEDGHKDTDDEEVKVP